MTITALPTPPSRSDPANFSARSDAFLGALPAFATEANALQEDVNEKQVLASDAAAITQQALDVGLANAAGNAATATSQAGLATAAKVGAETALASAVAVVTGGTASLKAAAGKLPIADGAGRLDQSWYAALLPNMQINHIGWPGTAGFGVGICPSVPAGYTALAGATDPASSNYGNYQYSDGSIMCWIPAFYFRLGHASNPTYGTYGVNSIDVKPSSAFPDQATANASGYYLHRAFINAGVVQLGFFRDKYDCSNNSGTASSIAGAMPLVSAAATGNSPFNGLTGAPANAYYGAIAAAKTRGAKFFPESIFIADAITRLTEAHAQAATSATWCAWYDASGIKNFPKGNNNSALKDVDDITVTFTGAGASGSPLLALTGSGSNFSKTTHNGQACGVSDVNGNIYKINPGMTSIAVVKTISGASQTNPVALQVTGHGRTTGDVVQIDAVVGMTQINSRIYTVTVIDPNNLSLNGVDGTAFTAYASGGTLTTATFYALKPAVDIAAVTAGTTLSTDHWGATGVAAQFDAVTLNFATTYPNNAISQRYGNGANAVFDMSNSNGRALAMLGMPAAAGMSASGTNLFGLDYYYQYLRDQLCVISRGHWGSGSNAGSRFRHLGSYRPDALYYVGFAAASYL